mgnify:CR=1 FL=1
MSDYQTNSTVTVNVNGKDAENKLSQLRQRADDLRNAIARAGAEGDKVNQEKFRKELRQTTKEIRLMESSTAEVERVMKNLNRATPKELQRTLTQLNKELKNMERGTSAWDAQTNKIRQVRAELDKVNSSLREHESWFSRINRKLNDWGVTIAAVVASLTGLVFSAKKAVQAYADMDTAMADTKKFTGMTSEQVAALNEEFKKMDTRSSREQLNQMAQAAGRLGKNTTESVMGFVRAADVISVAMDELGEDAPQIIAQLAGIFNVEQELGTERSMLAVGSAINTLSQNCAASAPNLVDFSSRLGAIASQTGMTIDEMLAFGAVLDANRVSVEKSATAIQSVLSKMMANPADFAQKAGLAVDEFTAAIQRSSTDALRMFVEHLSQLDKLDIAAILANLKVQDSGVIQTFNTLAGKVGDLNNQLEISATAFAEATSATEEFSVQNNTKQAGLDKSKKKFDELAVLLGEKLMPIMGYAISSTSAFMRILNVMIDFIVQYKGALVTITASIVAYTIAVNASNIAFKAHYAWLVITQTAQKVLTASTLLARAAYYALTGNLLKANAAMKVFNTLTKMNPWGLLAAGITAAAGALLIFLKRTEETSAAEKAIADITKKVSQAKEEETHKIEALISIAKDETLSLIERNKAISALNSIIPNYNASLDATSGKYKENKQALDDYLVSLEKKTRMEAVKEKYDALVKAEVEAGMRYTEANDNYEKIVKKNAEAADNVSIAPYGTGGNAYASAQISIAQNTKQAEASAMKAKKEWEDAKDSVAKLVEYIKQNEGTVEFVDSLVSVNGPSQTITPTDTGGGSSQSDALKKDYERQIAEAKIAYATGLHDYRAYQNNLMVIEAEYIEKRLENNSLELAERKKLEAQLAELYKKNLDEQSEFTMAKARGDIEEEHRLRLAALKRQYADGSISDASYREASFREEISYLEQLKDAYLYNAEERAKIEAQIDEKLLTEKLRKKQEHENRLAKIEEQFFGMSQAEKDAAYQQDLNDLNIVYQSQLAAAQNNAEEKLRIEEAYQEALKTLRLKYNQESNEDAKPEWISQLADFMESDGFKSFEKGLSVVNSAIGGLFSSYSQLVQAELDIQTAAINERYDKEVEAANGNSAKISQIEKQREAEITKAKNDASKKQYSMQVIQAIAQTAQNIIAAVGAGMQFGVAAPVMIPVLTGIATATGAVQIAALRKQQQAAASQGYSTGGFTKPGPVNEPAGIVHAGEWVASQKLLANPTTRSLINALDYAQRTNTIGSIRMSDVHTAMPTLSPISGSHATQTAQGNTNKELEKILAMLIVRLNQPFVTVNTVEGDYGIKKAQEEYDKLIKNKSPKR